MHYLSRHLILYSSLILINIFSCTKDQVSDTMEPLALTSQAVMMEELEILDYLDSQNFNIDSVEFRGENVVYERDASWTKTQLLKSARGEYAEVKPENDPDAAELSVLALDRQEGLSENNLQDAITATNVSSITYYISPSVELHCGVNWPIAINAAAQDWNQISNCQVNLTETFNLLSADIVLASDLDPILPSNYQNLPFLVVAQGNFPNDGRPGRYISIRSGYNLFPWAKGTIKHEIGHNLGLYHTGTGQGTQIHTTPIFESGSLMNPTVTAGSSNFKPGDLRAIRMYYSDGYFAPDLRLATNPTPGTVRLRYSNPGYDERPYYWVRVAKYDVKGTIMAVRYYQADSNGWNNPSLHTVEWAGHAPKQTYRFAIRGCNFRRDVWSARSQQITIGL